MPERVERRGERQNEGERRIEEAQRIIRFLPAGHIFVFRIDEQRHATRLRGDGDAAFRRSEKQAAAQPLPLNALVDREPSEPKHGDLIATEATRHDCRNAIEFERGRTQCVEAEDSRWRLALRATKHLAPPLSWFWRA